MAKYIEFGFRNKKLLLPFSVALIQIIINIIVFLLNEKIKNPPMDMITTGVSEMSFLLLRYLDISSIRVQAMRSSKSRYPLKKKFLHFLILFIIFSLYVIFNIFIGVQGNIYAQKFQNPHNSGFSCLECLEMIFLCIVSTFLLKYKYYSHHIVSIILFIILCIFIDLMLGNFPYMYERGPWFIVINVILVLLDAIDYGYQKYMMDVLYYPFWYISFTIGLVNFIIFGIIIIIGLIIGEKKALEQKNIIYSGFFKYFHEVSTGIIIVKQIVVNFIFTFLLNLFRGLTILHFTPDYILISFAMSRIVNVVIETRIYVCLALFPLQFFVLMLYLEIIELKFCGLNTNTRRNIQIRGQKELNKGINDLEGRISDLSNRSSNANDIDINADYSVSNTFSDNDIEEDKDKYYQLREKNDEE